MTAVLQLIPASESMTTETYILPDQKSLGYQEASLVPREVMAKMMCSAKQSSGVIDISLNILFLPALF